MAKEDKRIMDLLQQVEKKKAAISKSNEKYKTNCQIPFNGSIVNLNVEDDVQKLIVIAATIINDYQLYQDTAKFLGLTKFPQRFYLGFSKEDIVNDISIRINRLQAKDDERQLKALELSLKELLSGEKQTKLKVDELAAKLASA
jgi:hypothetical protein